MTDINSSLVEAIAAVRIYPPTRYSWFGQMSPRLPPRTVAALSERTARDYLVHNLAGQLYADFYLRGRAEPALWAARGSNAARQQFEAALSVANSGHGYLDSGWCVLAVEGTKVVIARGGLELDVDRLELSLPQGRTPSVGEDVALSAPKELFRVSPGFYTVCGDRPLHATRLRPLARLYWNLCADGAAPFVAAATDVLNDAQVPFRFKVLNDPAAFTRCDAGVVYVAVEDYHSAAQTVFALHAEVARFLSPRTPVFTKYLAPGLSYAEDPGLAESFGQHRCRLLADALVRAHECAWTGTEKVLEEVVVRFAEDGVDLEAAHLSPQQVDDMTAAS